MLGFLGLEPGGPYVVVLVFEAVEEGGGKLEELLVAEVVGDAGSVDEYLQCFDRPGSQFLCPMSVSYSVTFLLLEFFH